MSNDTPTEKQLDRFWVRYAFMTPADVAGAARNEPEFDRILAYAKEKELCGLLLNSPLRCRENGSLIRRAVKAVREFFL